MSGFIPNIPFGGNDKGGGGGGGGGVSQSDSVVSLIDDQGGGVYVPFLRHINNSGAGVITVRTTTVDGTTPYVPSGTVSNLFDRYITLNISVTESQQAGAGNTTAGIQKLSVFNSGTANGTFNGATLEPGTGREYEAYIDPNTKTFYRLASFAYDATGTTFDISETP